MESIKILQIGNKQIEFTFVCPPTINDTCIYIKGR